jgi:hypothetical protein
VRENLLSGAHQLTRSSLQAFAAPHMRESTVKRLLWASLDTATSQQTYVPIAASLLRFLTPRAFAWLYVLGILGSAAGGLVAQWWIQRSARPDLLSPDHIHVPSNCGSGGEEDADLAAAVACAEHVIRRGCLCHGSGVRMIVGHMRTRAHHIFSFSLLTLSCQACPDSAEKTDCRAGELVVFASTAVADLRHRLR